MKLPLLHKILILSCLLPALNLSAQSKSKEQAKVVQKELTLAQRETMAQTHEKMAGCLRDQAKTFNDCRQDMQTSCQTMGSDVCPMMMGKGHMGMGM